MSALRPEDVTRRPPAARFGVPIIAVGLALLLTLQLRDLTDQMPFALFFAAVALSAWYGGFGPGLLATALSAVASLYFFLPPYNTLAIDGFSSLARLALFALVAMLINGLSAARTRADAATAVLLAREQQARATIEEAHHRSTALAAASRAFTVAGLDVQRVAEVTVRQLAEVLGDNCVLRLLSTDGQRLEPVATYHPDPTARAFLQEMVAASSYNLGEGPSSQVVQTGQPLLVPVVQPEELRPTIKPEYWPYLERFGVHSLLIVPLRAQGRVVGTLRVSRDAPGRPYTEADQAFLQELADRAALALGQAQLYRQAQDAIALRDEFLALASHELKTPVTAIKGYAQLALRTLPAPADARRQRNLQMLNTQTDRLVGLINELLDVSRIQSGIFTFTPERFDLREQVEEVLHQISPTAGVTLESNLPPGLVPVELDRARLAQVITNLAQNAIKYSPPAGRVLVTLRCDGNEAILSVQDWGIGIPTDQQAQIFGRFVRGRNAAQGHYSGLGLGLFIAQRIVTGQGGRIWLRSTEGQGSTFYVALPLAGE